MQFKMITVTLNFGIRKHFYSKKKNVFPTVKMYIFTYIYTYVYVYLLWKKLKIMFKNNVKNKLMIKRMNKNVFRNSLIMIKDIKK